MMNEEKYCFLHCRTAVLSSFIRAKKKHLQRNIKIVMQNDEWRKVPLPTLQDCSTFSIRQNNKETSQRNIEIVMQNDEWRKVPLPTLQDCSTFTIRSNNKETSARSGSKFEMKHIMTECLYDWQGHVCRSMLE